jgi:hypothetical protein
MRSVPIVTTTNSSNLPRVTAVRAAYEYQNSHQRNLRFASALFIARDGNAG